MKRELSGLADRAAENQKRYESGAGAQRDKARIFKAAATAIIKEQRAAAVIKPQHSEK